jgi:hypothetical protein
VIHRPFIIFCFALSLCSCDKSGSANAGKEAPAADTPREGRGHASRKPTPGPLAALRIELEEAIKIERPSERAQALAHVAWNALETNLEIAHEAYLRLPADSPEKIRLIQHYALRLAEQDPKEALAWAESLGTELEVATAKCQIALALADTEPLRAANLLSESGVEGRDFDVAVVQVIQRWATQSLPDAADWVSSFPSGQLREAGIKVIASHWLPRDPTAAFAWLDSMNDTRIRAEAARAMEGVILQQTNDIRDSWLKNTDARIIRELEQQRGHAMKDVGDNVPVRTD